jgi:hypothetical protein
MSGQSEVTSPSTTATALAELIGRLSIEEKRNTSCPPASWRRGWKAMPMSCGNEGFARECKEATLE